MALNNNIDKNTILRQLQSTSGEIASEFDKLYQKDIENIAEEMAICYSISLNIINREDQSKIPDNDFQSALIYWTSIGGSVILKYWG